MPGATNASRAPSSAAPSSPVDATPPPRVPETETEGLAGWLTVVGASVVAVGAGGVIGFGLRADDLHDTYLAHPSVDTRDEGLVMKGLANASIAVGCVGALLVVGDLLLFRTGETVRADARGLVVRF